VVREGVGAGGEMTQALYAHMNKKKLKLKLKKKNPKALKSVLGSR
jgi:NaMN:DMB phosphoribosyltransferase